MTLALLAALMILGFCFTHWDSMVNKSLHHHAVFLLTLVSLLYTAIDLSISMNYFRLGYHPYRSIPFCLWWYWFEYSVLTMSLLLTATASLQRHILIFHSHWLLVRNRRLLLHYLPLWICMVYPPIFYIGFMFLYSCEVYFNPNDGWCAYPCYMDSLLLYNVDWLSNIVSPVFFIVLANGSLLVRVVRSMRRVRQGYHRIWKRQRRLTLQLFALSSLYLIVWFPTTVVALLHAFLLPNLYEDVPNIYQIYHLIYFVCPLQAILCVFSLPELMTLIRQVVRRSFRRTVVAPSDTVRSVR